MAFSHYLHLCTSALPNISSNIWRSPFITFATVYSFKWITIIKWTFLIDFCFLHLQNEQTIIMSWSMSKWEEVKNEIYVNWYVFLLIIIVYKLCSMFKEHKLFQMHNLLFDSVFFCWTKDIKLIYSRNHHFFGLDLENS